MAEVFAGRDRMLERMVAIKRPRRDTGVDAEVSERLQREALALGSIDSPHVVAIHDVGATQHGVYLVMQRLSGARSTRRSTRTARCPPRARAGSRATSSPGSPRSMPAGWSTATSRRPTCCSIAAIARAARPRRGAPPAPAVADRARHAARHAGVHGAEQLAQGRSTAAPICSSSA